MTREKAIEILTKELKCNNLDECNLKCDECGMCVDSKDLMEAYETAISAFKVLDAYETAIRTLKVLTESEEDQNADNN